MKIRSPFAQKQRGFTLIELIMVIVILGVLSAFALPRFADFGQDARTASLNALAVALRAAAGGLCNRRAVHHAPAVAVGRTERQVFGQVRHTDPDAICM